MSKKIYLGVLFTLIGYLLHAQDIDTLEVKHIDAITISESAQMRTKRENTIPTLVVDREDMALHFSGNLMSSLEYLPGIQSMSVGSGFSKPMIRGMAFNRVTVTENGVKQEGQQWGSDHGLEIDAYNVEQVNILKGPASLMLGSDAMGGVIEILAPVMPYKDGIYGCVDLLGRSVNGLVGGSLMLGYKKNNWFIKGRYSEQHYGDLSVPTDTIVYLTQKIAITDNQLNNTAGFDRSGSLYTQYQGKNHSLSLSLSDAYQKVGFFAAAHGIPDANDVIDDGNKRDIDLPYSFVNHFKAIVNLKRWWSKSSITWDLAYQNNHREEWSEFHTHYSSQTAPEIDPDKELAFMLDTYSSNIKAHIYHSNLLKSSICFDVQYQDNDIAGYSFLLPEYNRITSGAAWVANYNPTSNVMISGGLRYDLGYIKTQEYIDEYLVDYLTGMGYSSEVIEANRIRSYATERLFGDYSFSTGVVWTISNSQDLRFNIGRSFRLPSANELSSNGLHHSSFRHEQGDPTLNSEKGWQFDTEYGFKGKYISFNISPYFSWYQNYIYLRPTGQWSVLPHAGQIYLYSQTEAIFAGAEVSATANLTRTLSYELSAEYCYTYNILENTALPYSPPMTMRNKITWSYRLWSLFGEWHYVADQNRVARNEDATPGANLFNCGVTRALPFITRGATATLQADNIFNTKYLNHLSYYRQIEVPEPGRNIQISIKIPF